MKQEHIHAGAAISIGLPLADPGKARAVQPGTRWRLPRGLWRLPLLIGVLFIGAVIGLYFQPPGLRAFFDVTGLEPGRGTAYPIAVAPAVEASATTVAGGSQPPQTVVALGRLIPEGDAVTVAPPYGASDARVSSVLVEEGDRVAAGERIALLDSLPQFEALRDSAAAAFAVGEAALAQVRSSVTASLGEAKAVRERAEAAAALAETELARVRELHARGVAAQAALDEAETAATEAARELDRTRAALSRYAGIEAGTQPDILLAERNLAAARADLARAGQDLAKGVVTAPAAGTILKLHARAGETPGTSGVATIGDTERMTAELEVYQTDVRRVAPGQRVEITAEALGAEPLTGAVTRVGLQVGRQNLIAADPAANTDARVILVTVALDAASSARAARLSGLEVIARIAGEAGR